MNLRLALATLLLTVSFGCSSSPSAPTPSPAPGTNVLIVSGSSTMTTTAYAPNPVSVAVGGTVSWVNNDTTAHTSTADGGAWSSGSIAPGGQFSHRFDAAGTFSYACTLHPNMIGTVRVQ